MNKNTTPFSPEEYNQKIQRTVPFYEEMHASILDLVQTVRPNPLTWLDTGCGTGALVEKASRLFPQTAFSLADPSEDMRTYANHVTGSVYGQGTAELELPGESFDVITAVFSHHYLSEEERRSATRNCRRMLKKGGIYITFENIHPQTPEGTFLLMKRWLRFKQAMGEAQDPCGHYRRFDSGYFPITAAQHLDLLENVGFHTAELFWMTYMQAGFFAIK